MGKARRIGNFITGLLTITIGILLILYPEEEYDDIVLFLGLIFFIKGIQMIAYYITDIPRVYVMLYLFIIRLVTGIIDILRALEAKSMEAVWIRKMLHGMINIILALYCIIFIKDLNTVVFVFSIGMIYSGYVTLITSLRKTAIVYIS